MVRVLPSNVTVLGSLWGCCADKEGIAADGEGVALVIGALPPIMRRLRLE
jgi:hypothetical protein